MYCSEQCQKTCYYVVNNTERLVTMLKTMLRCSLLCSEQCWMTHFSCLLTNKGRQMSFSLFPMKFSSFKDNVNFFTLSYKSPFFVLHSGSVSTFIFLRLPYVNYLCNNLWIFISNGNIKNPNAHRSYCKWPPMKKKHTHTKQQLSENCPIYTFNIVTIQHGW